MTNRARRSQISQQCRGVSPRRQASDITSPRLPSYVTMGGHESRASQVIERRVLSSFRLSSSSSSFSFSKVTDSTTRTRTRTITIYGWSP